MLSPRQQAALTALVRDYLGHGEAVASGRLKTLMETPCSPATLRGDLMALGEMGYLHQDHHSAGRVPTDAGLRFYVNHLPAPRPDPQQQAWLAALMQRMEGTLEGFLEALAEGLSEASGLLCLVAVETTHIAVLEHVDLSWVNNREALLILGLKGAQPVITRLKLPQSAAEALVRRVAQRLREQLMDAPLEKLQDADVEELLNTIALDERRLMRQSLLRAREVLGLHGVRRQAQARGLGRLAGALPAGALGELSDQLFSQVYQVLGHGPATQAQVLIGSEMPLPPLGPLATVRTLADPTPGVRCVTVLLGPKRLPYSHAMSLASLGSQWAQGV